MYKIMSIRISQFVRDVQPGIERNLLHLPEIRLEVSAKKPDFSILRQVDNSPNFLEIFRTYAPDGIARALFSSGKHVVIYQHDSG